MRNYWLQDEFRDQTQPVTNSTYVRLFLIGGLIHTLSSLGRSIFNTIQEATQNVSSSSKPFSVILVFLYKSIHVKAKYISHWSLFLDNDKTGEDKNV